MAISAYKTWAAAEVLTAADLNSSFSQLINNAADMVSPLTKNIAAGTFKLTGLGAGTAAGDSLRYEQLADATTLATCDGRLTLTTGVPVTTADVTAAETLYFAPYRGNRIALYDGSSTWNVRTFTELSIDVPDVTGVHDVFVYDNAGTPTLEVLVWTDETNRATALTTQNGVLVKTGATTRRYVGSFYSTTAGLGQIEDSVANRYLWNYYNRVTRPMRVLEGTATWAYTTDTIRQANGAAGNQLNLVVGYSEDLVSAEVVSMASNSAGSVQFHVGIGLDSTTASATGCLKGTPFLPGAGVSVLLTASLKTYPGVGKHYLAWLEQSQASGTTTWTGIASDAARNQCGIHGEILG